MTSPAPSARPALAVIADLMFRAKIDEAARRLDVPLRVARSAEQLERHLTSGVVPSVVLVDLEIETLDPTAAIARLKRDPATAAAPIVAFAGHTNVAALRAGRDAGATRVLARSAFAESLPEILAAAARAAEPSASD